VADHNLGRWRFSDTRHSTTTPALFKDILIELASLHDLINVPFHHKNIAQPGWACLAREHIKDATWLLVKRLVQAGT
jgi:hypothetical protein